MCNRCEWESIAEIAEQVGAINLAANRRTVPDSFILDVAKSIRTQKHVTPRQRAVVEKQAIYQTTVGLKTQDSGIAVEIPNYDDLPPRSKGSSEQIIQDAMQPHPRVLVCLAMAEIHLLKQVGEIVRMLIPPTTNLLVAEPKWWEALKVIAGSWPKAYVKAAVLYDGIVLWRTSVGGLGRGQFDLAENFLKQGKSVGTVEEWDDDDGSNPNPGPNDFKLVKVARVIRSPIDTGKDDDRDWKLDFGRAIFA
jgi:hypothetical protein